MAPTTQHKTNLTFTAVTAKPVKPFLADLAEDLGIRFVNKLGAGLRTFAGDKSGNRFGILMYHRIAENTPGVPKPSINVTPDQFAKQIEGLVLLGYQFWPLRKMLDHYNSGKRIPALTTAVTFDDGFEGIYHNVWPVISDLQVPITIFLCTAFLDNADPFHFDYWGQKYRDQVPAESYRPLSVAQCQDLAADPLVDFGAHTHTHQDFRGRPNDLRQDLETNVAELERLFGQKEFTFAFPYGTPRLGYASDEMVEAVRQVGVKCSLSTQGILNEPFRDPYHWGRFNVFPWDTAKTIAGRLGGWYSWAPKLKHFFLQPFTRKDFSNRNEKSTAGHEENCVIERARSLAAINSTLTADCLPGKADCLPGKADLVSIIMPTFNRAHWVGDAIRSLAQQETNGRFKTEIIVVDNASSDNTREAVEAVAEECDVPVRYFCQEKPGDAPTRNCGIRNAQGKWCAFFDDDQLAEPQWLKSLYFAALATNALVAGGPVKLDLPEETLKSLGHRCRLALREIDHYENLQPYEDSHLPGTGNALVAKRLFEEIGEFDESMVNGGSDFDFFVRAREAGYEIWYSPEAVIRHRISEERLSPNYFRWDAMSSGAEHAAYFDYERSGVAMLLAMCLLRVAKSSVLDLPRYLWNSLRGRKGEALGYRSDMWRTEGYVRRTLSIISPAHFPQRDFFDNLNFRDNRPIES